MKQLFTTWRGNVLLGSYTILVGFMMLLGFLMSPLFGTVWGLFLGFLAGVLIGGYVFPMFIYNVGPNEGAVLKDMFTGELRVVLTGLNLRYPWEILEDGDHYVTLDVRRQEHPTEGESAENYPTADRGAIAVKWGFQYHPSPDHLDVYICISDEVIDSGFKDMISAWISEFAARYNAPDLPGKNQELRDELHRRLNDEKITVRDGNGKRVKRKARKVFQDNYGIEVDHIWVTDIDLPERIRDAWDMNFKSQQIKEAVERMRNRDDLLDEGRKEVKARIGKKRAENPGMGEEEARDAVFEDILRENPAMSQKDATNAVMLTRKDSNVTKSIQEVEGEGAEAAMSFLLAAFGRGNRQEGGQ